MTRLGTWSGSDRRNLAVARWTARRRLDLRGICGGEAEVVGHPDQGPPDERADLLGAQTERRRYPDRQVTQLRLARPAEDREIDQVQGAQNARAAARLGMAVLYVELQPRCACGRHIYGLLAGGQNERGRCLPAAREEPDQFTGPRYAGHR